MPGLARLARRAGETSAAVGRAWSRFWFHGSTTEPLEIVRIGIGAAVLFHYGMATPFLFDLWGDAGWMPPAAALDRLALPWMQSVFFYFTAPWQWAAFHLLFLLCCAALMVGWRTSWVKWIVLAGQISYDYRNPTLVYGADTIVACLLFMLCLAPVGRAMSLDRARAKRVAKRGNLAATPPSDSPWAGACIRLMQIQMAVLVLRSGIEKTGWNGGDAAWPAFTDYEFYNPVIPELLARHDWLADVATDAAILIAVAFPFLIWQRRTRPYMLAAALSLHLTSAVLAGSVYLSFVMSMGHMSFLRPEWLHRLGAWWKGKVGAVAVASRLRGHPVYQWVAASRSRLPAMTIPQRWRERLLYSAMSLFVAWHAFIMLVGPNSSETAGSIRRLVQPYLSFFRLESTWSFFAPSVGKHSQFRYVIEESAGHARTFVPVPELNSLLPSYYLIKHSYDAVVAFPELHAELFAAMFCRKHAALRPSYVTLQVALEQEFSPADQLAGKNPLDPDFVKVETLLRVPCESEADAGVQ